MPMFATKVTLTGPEGFVPIHCIGYGEADTRREALASAIFGHMEDHEDATVVAHAQAMLLDDEVIKDYACRVLGLVDAPKAEEPK